MKKFFFTLLAIAVVISGYIIINKNTQHVKIPANWIIYTGNGVQFMYPEKFGAHVWKSTTRPPQVTMVTPDKDPIALGCPLLKDTGIPLHITQGKTDRLSYTLYTGWDIGAWSLYTSECYVFSWDTTNYVIDFEIRSHSWCEDENCWAYCGTEFEQECKDFDILQDVLQPIKTIISTFKIIE